MGWESRAEIASRDAPSGHYRFVLTSPRLSFTRDGKRLLVLDDALSIVELASSTTRRVPVDHPRAVVGFVDQVWVAHGHDPHLARFTDGGRALGDSTPLIGDGMLVAAPVGAPAAVWATSAFFDDGQLRDIPVPAADHVLPLTARRWVTVTGPRVVAPSGLSCELGARSRVQGGAIILDGTAVALVVERAGAREVVVVGLSNGRAQLGQSICSGVVRIAARRGVLGLAVGPREIVLVDLRSGRALGELHVPFEFADFALDPDGTTLAARDGETSIELIDVKQALAAKPVVVAAAPVEAAADTDVAPGIEVTVATPPPPPRFARPFDLRCLSPIEPVELVGRERALELLDLELRTVALWTLRAIAHAWDTRRLGFGNEGNHPYEHEVAALLGMNAGFATDYVTAATEHLDAHVASLPADARAPGSPLGGLARELQLSPLAIDILLVVAAPAVWSEAARLYGILANDPARPLVDQALVEQILGARASRHEIAATLDPRAPLLRLGILDLDRKRARPFGGLTVDPIILARLRCELPDLGLGIAARGSSRGLEELVVGQAVIEDALDALAHVHTAARIAVRGRSGSGRRTLLAAIAAEAHRALGVIDMSLLARSQLPGALRRAQLAGLLPCIVGLEELAFGERDERDVLVEVLRAHPGPLAIVTTPDHAVPLDAGHVAIELPVLPESDRLAVWRTALADAGVVSRPELLAARYRIGPGAIHRALAAVRERGAGGEVTAPLEHYIRRSRDARLGQHARRVERLATWDNLVLPADILDSLRELVGRVRHRRTVFETWGMEQTMTTSRGLTALFSGPPGTGKTLVAGVIARELGLELYQIDLSKLMSKWIGETERNLSTIFDAAEDGQVILLFDEADSLFAKRTEVRSSNDRYANLEVNYLLQRLDSFEGIAILTTNASSSIDQAFKRRLSFRLSFPFPDEETRVQLWRAHLPATLPTRGPLQLDKLAHKYQLSGGYIRNACLRAAFLAAQDETPLSQHHLDRAVTLEYAELGKLSNSGAID